MELTKEECEKAISIMCKDCKLLSSCNKREYCQAYWPLRKLIDEHFDNPLLPHCKRLMERIVMQSECIEELNDQLSRYCEWEMEQVQMRQNSPLKFEELCEDEPVFDKKHNCWRYILQKDYDNKGFYDPINDEWINFEEGRFFAREVKE